MRKLLAAGSIMAISLAFTSYSPTSAMASRTKTSVVIRVEHVGGFVGPNFSSARLPDVVLYSDGLLLAQSNQNGSVRQMFQGSVSKSVLQAEISTFTRVAKSPSGGWGLPGVSDLPSTEVSVTQNGKKSITDVYALGFPLKSTEATATAARKSLSQAINKLVALAGKTTVYQPTNYEVWPSWVLSDGSGQGTNISNPAALFCLSQNGILVSGKVLLNTATPPPDLSTEYCNLPDGSFVDEWSYFYRVSKTGIPWPGSITAPQGACVSVIAKPFISLLRSAGTKQWLLPNGSMINLMWRPVLPGETACKR